MEPLFAIIIFGILMSSLALIGGFAYLISEAALQKLLLPMVALAAGSLIGGALLHLLPEAVALMGNQSSVYLWTIAGFVSFLILEQLLHWHHCHRTPSQHTEPLSFLLLIADGLHNFIGGLAVGAAFIADFRVGLAAWLVAAAHEIPQELGDFGVLVHGGWQKGKALLFNFISALTFPIGGLLAYAVSGSLSTDFLIAFAAGNFLYIGAVDLVPEIKHEHRLPHAGRHLLFFLLGIALLLGLRVLFNYEH